MQSSQRPDGGPGTTHQRPPPLEGTQAGLQPPQQISLNEEEQGEVGKP